MIQRSQWCRSQSPRASRRVRFRATIGLSTLPPCLAPGILRPKKSPKGSPFAPQKKHVFIKYGFSVRLCSVSGSPEGQFVSATKKGGHALKSQCSNPIGKFEAFSEVARRLSQNFGKLMGCDATWRMGQENPHLVTGGLWCFTCVFVELFDLQASVGDNFGDYIHNSRMMIEIQAFADPCFISVCVF